MACPIYCAPAASDWLRSWRGDQGVVIAAAPPDLSGAPYLWAVDEHLELRFGPGPDEGAWVRAEEVRRRTVQAGDLLRACGLRRQDAAAEMRVLDAMAGWGVDGLVLAASGACVTLVELDPLLHATVEDLIRRMGTRNARAVCGDGYASLDGEPGFDIVYLDPMFPERNKHALPGKRMQLTGALLRARALSGAPVDEVPLDAWLEAAIRAARARVVVKRRLKDPADRRADWQIRGRTVRYDVYRGRNTAERPVSAPAAPRSGSPAR